MKDFINLNARIARMKYILELWENGIKTQGLSFNKYDLLVILKPDENFLDKDFYNLCLNIGIETIELGDIIKSRINHKFELIKEKNSYNMYLDALEYFAAVIDLSENKEDILDSYLYSALAYANIGNRDKSLLNIEKFKLSAYEDMLNADNLRIIDQIELINDENKINQYKYSYTKLKNDKSLPLNVN